MYKEFYDEFEDFDWQGKPKPQVFAFLTETEEIVEYTECINIKDKEKWHDKVLSRGRKFIGEGNIYYYTLAGELKQFHDEIHLFYV